MTWEWKKISHPGGRRSKRWYLIPECEMVFFLSDLYIVWIWSPVYHQTLQQTLKNLIHAVDQNGPQLLRLVGWRSRVNEKEAPCRGKSRGAWSWEKNLSKLRHCTPLWLWFVELRRSINQIRVQSSTREIGTLKMMIRLCSLRATWIILKVTRVKFCEWFSYIQISKAWEVKSQGCRNLNEDTTI